MYIQYKISLITKVLILSCLMYGKVSSLECYVCKDQDNNKDKCIETVKTCELTDDRCLTEVRWGSTPYWAPTGEKQFYLSKRCASKRICEQSIRNLGKRCDRIWYNDWECVECCNGDRCNYYITLASNHLNPQIITIIVSILMAFLLIH